jgi:hypothetical protein
VKRRSGKWMRTIPTQDGYRRTLRIANPVAIVCAVRAGDQRAPQLTRSSRGSVFRAPRVSVRATGTSTTLNHAAEHITAHRPRLSRASCADLQRRGSPHYGLRPRALEMLAGVQNVLTSY